MAVRHSIAPTTKNVRANSNSTMKPSIVRFSYLSTLSFSGSYGGRGVAYQINCCFSENFVLLVLRCWTDVGERVTRWIIFFKNSGNQYLQTLTMPSIFLMRRAGESSGSLFFSFSLPISQYGFSTRSSLIASSILEIYLWGAFFQADISTSKSAGRCCCFVQ